MPRTRKVKTRPHEWGVCGLCVRWKRAQVVHDGAQTMVRNCAGRDVERESEACHRWLHPTSRYFFCATYVQFVHVDVCGLRWSGDGAECPRKCRLGRAARELSRWTRRQDAQGG